MRRTMKAVLATAIFAFGGARADTLSTITTALPDFDSFMLMRLGDGPARPVSADQAADILRHDDVVFIGELHDHIANHLAETALLRALAARVPHLALSMEQFERDVQPVVNDYLAGTIGEETLKTKGRAWPNYAEAYRPLIEFAKDRGFDVIAANAPQQIVRCVAQEGLGFLDRLPPEQRAWAARTVHTENGPYKREFMRFLGSDPAHGGPADDPAAKRRAEDSFAAQALRDDTMAESIARYARAHPGTMVVHVTGVFHVAGRLGTVARLEQRAPDLRIGLVVPAQAGNPDAPAIAPGDAKGADVAILLRREPEAYATEAEKKAGEAGEMAKMRAARSGACTP